mgnify:CR=1 FL=1
MNQGHRKVFRYQVQGPKAVQVMEKVTGRPVPNIRFFYMDNFKIAEKTSARCVTGWSGNRDGRSSVPGNMATPFETPFSRPARSTACVR